MTDIDPIDQDFSDLLARMTREQKRFLCECFQDHEAGRCTFEQMLAEIGAGLEQAGN